VWTLGLEVNLISRSFFEQKNFLVKIAFFDQSLYKKYSHNKGLYGIIFYIFVRKYGGLRIEEMD
jgi:hypothetical protein